MAEDSDITNSLPNWLLIARECVSAEDWQAIVREMIKRAKAGDQKACDFIASFVLPKERPDASDQRVKEVRLVFAPPPEGK